LINHHPTEPTLLAYAAGTLPEALGIVIATHIELCADCQRSLTALEAIAGALLEELSPMPLTSDAVERLLARLDELHPVVPPVLHPELPAPLDHVAMGRWWPIGIGMRYRPFRVAGAAWGGLILGQPGQSLPWHGHVGLELTCTLSGAFVDGTGEYHAGDLSEPMMDHDRPLRIIGNKPCLCIMASEGMRVRGLLGFGQRLIERYRNAARLKTACHQA
jgi:putative transcriptional regulator